MKMLLLTGALLVLRFLPATTWLVPTPAAAPPQPLTQTEMKQLVARYYWLRATEIPAVLDWLHNWGICNQPLPGQLPDQLLPPVGGNELATQ